jgi:hypothetical protein
MSGAIEVRHLSQRFIKLVDMAEDIYIYSQPYLPPMLPAELSPTIEGARWRDKLRETILFAQGYNFFEVLTTCHDITCQFMAGLPEIARVEWDEFRKLAEKDERAPRNIALVWLPRI